MQSTDIVITTQKPAKLAATVFVPDMPIVGAVMMGPATGIKRQFYHYFAQFLCQNGYGVITYDNEGIGDSLVGDVAACTASLVSWGRYDMTAVLDTLMQTFGNTRYHLIGHSAGGQLFGLMSNHHHLSSVFNFGSSSGCIANMRMPYRAKAMFFMDVFVPMSNALVKSTQSSWVGMGEALPKAVAAEWRAWCNGHGYIQTDLDTKIHTHYYNEIALPALWVNATDDDIANDKNVAEMIAVFPKMQAQTKTLDPKSYGGLPIGHMRFFSRKNAALWQLATDWLKAH